MELEIVNINDLISPDWNPRHITDNELEKLKKSIDEFGYVGESFLGQSISNIQGAFFKSGGLYLYLRRKYQSQ